MKRFFLFCLATLMPVWCLAQTDSVILRPNADFSNTGNRWRQDSIIAGAILGTICGTSDLWFRLKETQNGKDDSGYVEIDNDPLAGNCFLAGCNAFNADNGYKVDFDDYSTQKSYVPDSYAVYARSYACNAVDTTVFSVSFYDRLSSDLGVTRLGKASATGSYVTKRIGSGSTDGQGTALSSGLMDSLIVRMKGYVSGGGGESHHTQLYVVVYFHTDVAGPGQAARPPAPGRGDTLFPSANVSVALTADSGANWDLVNDDPGSSGCDDTLGNYTTSATVTTDVYELAVKNWSGKTEWGNWNGSSSDNTRQVDCLVVGVCVNRETATTGTASIRFGLIPKGGGASDSMMSADFVLPASTTQQSYSWPFPNKTVNGEVRWDSLALDTLRLVVKLRAVAGQRTKVRTAYAVIYVSQRNTNVPDSIALNTQVRAVAATAGITPNRQMAAVQSFVDTNKIWISTYDQAATNIWQVNASSDAGATWGYINGASTPDTAHARVSNDLFAAFGIGMTAQTNSSSQSATDSFLIFGLRAGTGVTGTKIIQTKGPSQNRSQLRAVAGTANADTARFDTCSVSEVAIRYPAVYELGDTVWVIGGSAVTSGRLIWARSKNRGSTFPDSGSFPDSAFTTAPTINTTAGNKRGIALIRWSNGYPAIFTCGWTGADTSAIRFYKWHPDQNAASDSIRLKAWLRSPGAVSDVRTVFRINGGGNAGEIAATSIFKSSDTIGHVTVVRGSYLVHGTINKGLTPTIDTVIDLPLGPANSSSFMSMAALDSFVYLYHIFNQKSGVGTDSSYVMAHLWAGNRFRGGRRLSFWWTPNGTFLAQQRNVSTAQYQKGAYTFAVFQDTARNVGTFLYLGFNKIIKPTAAAAGGENIRRRRILMGRREDEESDSLMLSVRSILGK